MTKDYYDTYVREWIKNRYDYETVQLGENVYTVLELRNMFQGEE